MWPNKSINAPRGLDFEPPLDAGAAFLSNRHSAVLTSKHIVPLSAPMPGDETLTLLLVGTRRRYDQGKYYCDSQHPDQPTRLSERRVVNSLQVCQRWPGWMFVFAFCPEFFDHMWWCLSKLGTRRTGGNSGSPQTSTCQPLCGWRTPDYKHPVYRTDVIHLVDSLHLYINAVIVTAPENSLHSSQNDTYVPIWRRIHWQHDYWHNSSGSWGHIRPRLCATIGGVERRRGDCRCLKDSSSCPLLQSSVKWVRGENNTDINPHSRPETVLKSFITGSLTYAPVAVHTPSHQYLPRRSVESGDYEHHNLRS